MKSLESLLSWAQSFGIGGAFFVIALCAFCLCGMALWVVLVAVRRGKAP